jgi:hypothetical protein
MMTLTIEIPALDRLCGILESHDKAGIVQAVENEIVAKLREAAEGGVPKPKFEEVPPADSAKGEIAPEPRKPAQEPPQPKSTNAPGETAAPAPDAKPVTLEAIQLAAAQMRDQGKLKAVTDLFPEFGIKKLSDLKGEKLQAFGERLRAMGARV